MTVLRPEPEVDLEAMPWSRRGSYMALSMNTQTRDHPGRDHAIEPGLYLCDVSGYRLWRWNGVFRIEALVDGSPVPMSVASASPTLLRLSAGGGTIEVTWDGPDTMRWRTTGVGIRLVQSVLDPLDAALAFPAGMSTWRLQMGEDAHYALTVMSGVLAVDAPRVRTGSGDTEDRKIIDLSPDEQGQSECAIAQYQTGYVVPTAFRAFDDALDDTRADLARWTAQFAPVSSDVQATGDAAVALLWTNTVAARGNLGRPAVLMSKNWMHAVWSWDHCFVALGLASGDRELAWDQYLLFFDRQAPDGMLADIVNDYGCQWGFCKPPVHGWALRKLIEAQAVPDAGLAEVYPKLAAWTDWWFTYRDDDGDGLSEYFHGCDSGQDNSAAFDETGFPAASPDLAAYLVVQMDVLADVAGLLGLPQASAQWQRRADAQLALLLASLWTEDGFMVKRGGDGFTAHAPHSQVSYLPLILGDRLPAAVRDQLTAQVRRVITEHGVASEGLASPMHDSDGYWRGPIWAPTTYLVIDGLRACDEPELADAVARGFIRMVQSAGFAENYEARTGRPLRDRGYSWAAAVFIRLACELTREPVIAGAP